MSGSDDQAGRDGLQVANPEHVGEHGVTSTLPADRDHQTRLPLSFAQERLWFLEQLEPGTPAYHVSVGYRLTGRLNISALEGALTDVIARHETLRTAISSTDGQAFQVIQPPSRFNLTVIDLTRRAKARREAEAKRIGREDAVRPFDLASCPLFRAALVRFSADEHIFFMTMHHIVSDGWSIGVLTRELALFYRIRIECTAGDIPSLPAQYADYAAWQRNWLVDDRREQQLAYWRGELSALPMLSLPTDELRPPVQTYTGRACDFSLSAELCHQLRRIARGEHATLYMVLLAAFQLLLARHAGQTDVAVGSLFAGRLRPEFEELIGFFVNTAVLRVDLEGDPSFRELIGRTRSKTLGAYENQDVPFEQIVAALNVERDLSRHPLFQVLLVLHNEQSGMLDLTGIDAQRFDVDSMVTRFDLELHLVERGAMIDATFVYNHDLFRQATIRRLARHFSRLLESASESPQAPISHLELLTDEERTTIVAEWNSTAADYPDQAGVPQLVEAQVDRDPDAVAVIFGTAELSYTELNGRANRLAHHLQRFGVRPEAPVAICMRRSPDLVIAVLAVLKAGGAYVPLDPEYPRKRLAMMLEDSGANVLLTEDILLSRLPIGDAVAICIDRDATAIRREAETNLGQTSGADNLAYIMYTSGSTGVPKGVAMPHRPLVNLLTWQRRRSQVEKPKRTLQFASLSFDVAFQEIFSTLIEGGSLVVIPEELRRDLRGIAAYIAEARIDRIFVPFVVLNELARHLDARVRQERLLEVITAGERLEITPAIRALWQRAPTWHLENQYGPTETHVVTSYRLEGDVTSWPALPPIGRPIANTQIRVLDHALRPVPIGVTGELYVGGVPLARGYMNRVDLTADRFVASPFGPSGARLYRTGDLARWRDDGNIEFLGRSDDQVKIRGFRVELGEVEAAIGSHPTVSETAVVAREDRPGERRLVAYVVGQTQEVASPAELRRFAKELLPDYMLPSAFVLLEALPMTRNGKLDREALPAPAGRLTGGDAYIAPRTRTEDVLASVWAELLCVDRVGIADDFFELGGHSLLAVRVTARTSEAFAIEVPMRLLFESPTVEGVARGIDELGVTADPGSLRRVERRRLSAVLTDGSAADDGGAARPAT